MEPDLATIPPAEEPPHWLRTVLDQPAPPRKPWTWSFAPAYIGLFLWVVYFDAIPREALSHGSLPWAVLGSVAGGLLAYLAFYLPAALWGAAARQPLAVVATRTFGLAGAVWVPLMLLTAVQVVWFALSIGYATRFCLTGLGLVRLLDPGDLAPMTLGVGGGPRLPSPLYAATSMVWTVFIALAGRYLLRVVVALMSVYPAAVALVLGATVVATLSGLSGSAGAFPVDTDHGLPNAAAATTAVQMVLGFFAAAGLLSADWGAAARDRGEVRTAGFVCVAMAAWIVATLAILSVVGARGLAHPVFPDGTPIGLPSMTFGAVLPAVFGTWIGGALLLALSLATLAPGCYAAALIGLRLHELRPGLSRSLATWAGAAAAWGLLLLGERTPLFEVFSVVGALLAPAAGALAVDCLRSGGHWPGPRAGWNWPGLAAWGLGVVAGLAPLVTDALRGTLERYRIPGVLLGFVTAVIVYGVLAAARLDRPTRPGLVPPPAEDDLSDRPS